MAYIHIENIGDRRGEKVAPFLTLETLIGVLIFVVPVFALTAGRALAWRFGLVGGAILAGVVTTANIYGMALYERALWRLRGALRRRLRGARIAPTDLPGVPHSAASPVATRADAALIAIASRQ